MPPAGDLDAAGQPCLAAPVELAKAHKGLEPDPDRFEQQRLTCGGIQLGKADLEVGIGDIGLLFRKTQQGWRDQIGKAIPQSRGGKCQQGKQAQRTPAAPPFGMQQAAMKNEVSNTD